MSENGTLSEGARTWIGKLEGKIDKTYEIVIRLDERFNTHDDLDEKVDKLESEVDRLKGALSAIKWVGSLFVSLGIIAQAISAYFMFFKG